MCFFANVKIEFSPTLRIKLNHFKLLQVDFREVFNICASYLLDIYELVLLVAYWGSLLVQFLQIKDLFTQELSSCEIKFLFFFLFLPLQQQLILHTLIQMGYVPPVCLIQNGQLCAKYNRPPQYLALSQSVMQNPVSRHRNIFISDCLPPVDLHP